MKLYRYRARYWNLSKLGNWILSLGGITRPSAETHEGWSKWKRESKATSPILFYIVEELLSDIQNICMFPYDVYANIRSYIRNRYIDKLQYLDTKLKPGQYYEISKRMLHGMFETLVDFVEVEKAQMYQAFTLELEDTYRSREDGLAHLAWEKELTNEGDRHYTEQAISAQEQEALYLWWKDIRPNRPDPWDVSGYNAFYDKRKDTLEDDWLGVTLSESDNQEQRRLFKVIGQIEEKYEDEDTEMLIRVIQIRRNLWT